MTTLTDEQNAFMDLREVLTSHYEDEMDARRIADDAGLSVRLINFDGKNINRWGEILKLAQKEGKIIALKESSLRDFPQSPKLVMAWGTYLDYTQIKKTQSIETEGDWFIGSDVHAGRDFVGHDSIAINNTNIHHHHYPATKTSRRKSSQKLDPQTIETSVVNTLIKFYHRWFPYILALIALQILFFPLIFIVTDLWPLLVMPSIILVGIFSYLCTQTKHQLTNAGFYDKGHSVPQREKLIHSLRQKDWGHWSRNWYTSLLLTICVEVDARRLKKR